MYGLATAPKDEPEYDGMTSNKVEIETGYCCLEKNYKKVSILIIYYAYSLAPVYITDTWTAILRYWCIFERLLCAKSGRSEKSGVMRKW